MKSNLTAKQKAWLKGLGIAVIYAIGSGTYKEIMSGGLPHTKAGWSAFVGTVLSIGVGAAHLYLTESPLSKLGDSSK